MNAAPELGSGAGDRRASARAADRRQFLRTAGLGAAGAALLAGCGLVGAGTGEQGSLSGPPAPANNDAGTGSAAGDEPEITWEMPSSWVRSLNTLWESNTFFASRVAALTGGRFVLNPREPGEVVGGVEVLQAVRDGVAPAGTTAACYYLDQSPILAFGTAMPFGLTTRQQFAWLYAGGGLELLQAHYAEKFNLIQFPVASTGAQMGGWFNREITTAADLKGLKMRIPGLGGEVMAALGVETLNLGVGEIATALEAGTVDAAEFIGPEDDRGLGLHERARYYYYPGFWEPSATLEVQINLDAWRQLPVTYQHAIRSAAVESSMWTMALYDARNGQALNDLVAAGTQLRIFPDEVLDAAQAASGLLLDRIAEQNPEFAVVLEHWRSFRRLVAPWFSLAEAALLR